MTTKWVQHQSGQGEKWEVLEAQSLTSWCVRANPGYHYLPKSEYGLCDPPEQWEDVTEECDWMNSGSACTATIYHLGLCLTAERGYRFRKVLLEHGPTATQKWAFIVERRKA